MRKLEAVTKEIVEEMGYLQRREMRMRDTNGRISSRALSVATNAKNVCREHKPASQGVFSPHYLLHHRTWCLASEYDINK